MCGKKVFGIYIIIERLKSRMNLAMNICVYTTHTTQPETEILKRFKSELAKDNK